MWSHYSRSHHGICIGFETTRQKESLFIARTGPNRDRSLDSETDYFLVSKVEYQGQYPQPVVFLDRKADELFAFMKTKGKDWEYEKEHRIILAYNDEKSTLMKFDKSALKEVILGSKVEPTYKEQVLAIIKKDYLEKGHSVEVFHSRLDDLSYKLNIHKINLAEN